MGRLRQIIYILITAVISLSIYSCNVNGCLENRSSIPLAGFYSSSTDKPIAIDSLIITGIGRKSNTPLYDGETPISTAYLPFRSTESSTEWDFSCRIRIDIDDSHAIYTTVSDTISFDYESSPYFASDECGVIYRYRITHIDYTTHLIESVVITDSLITNLDVERIKIYFRTS